jgi:quercetin dioxygenase-like cupin family protein
VKGAESSQNSFYRKERITMRVLIGAAFCVVLVFTGLMSAGEHGEGIAIHAPDKVKWQEGPPSLPKGAQVAVLEGDPAKEGPFVFRIKVPDGYRIPPHTHPKTERVTVIAGQFHIGMGDKFDEKAGKAMPAGSYGYWEAGMKHFAWAKGPTVVQLHGMGPWSIQYLNPADDPRNQGR